LRGIFIFLSFLSFSCLKTNINYDFLNQETESFEKGKNLKMSYFENGDRRFILETKNLESFETYFFVEKRNLGTCITDSVLLDFDFKNLNKDSLKNISVFSDSVLVKYYNVSGDTILEIFANKMIHYANEDIIELKNNVYLKNYNNNVLQTERLFWNMKKNKILSLDSVDIQTEDKIINGCGFYSDDNFENYKIYNISGLIQVDTD